MKITAMDKRASQARMRAYSDALDSTDPRFRGWVHLQHEDGSSWLLRSAFVMRDAGTGYVWILTEHFEDLVFEDDKISFLTEFNQGGA